MGAALVAGAAVSGMFYILRGLRADLYGQLEEANDPEEQADADAAAEAEIVSDEAPANPATPATVRPRRRRSAPRPPSSRRALARARPQPARLAPRPFILVPVHRRHRARGVRPPWLLQQQRPRAHKTALPHLHRAPRTHDLIISFRRRRQQQKQQQRSLFKTRTLIPFDPCSSPTTRRSLAIAQSNETGAMRSTCLLYTGIM